MRLHIREFVERVEQYFDLQEPIYEFGSRVSGQREQDVNLRPLFPDKQYIRTDLLEGKNVDEILDLHQIELPDETAGAVVCVETLEHVRYPWIALEELHRILKPGGVAVITSTMHFKIHNHPSDYFRFTCEGLKAVMEPFQTVWVDWSGDPGFPHTVVGLGFKGPLPDADWNAFRRVLEEKRILWKERSSTRSS